MAEAATVEIVNEREFSEKMERAAKIMNKTGAQMLEWFGIMFAKSGRAATKNGVKYRKIKKNTGQLLRWSDSGDGILKAENAPKFVIEVLKQPHGVKYLPKAQKAKTNKATGNIDRRVIIGNRGMGRESWGWIMKALKQSFASDPDVEPRARKQARKMVGINRDYKGVVKSLTLTNRLTYLTDMNPAIEQTASSKALAQMVQKGEKRLQEQLDRQVNK